MNHTTNYQLSQWERTDKVLMEDFNADNARIDEALGAHAAELAKLPFFGNCEIEYFTYTGTGKYGPNNPTVLTFSKQPVFFVVLGEGNMLLSAPALNSFVLYGVSPHMSSEEKITWNGGQVFFYSNATGTSAGSGYNNPGIQMNASKQIYVAVAFIAQNGT